MTIHKEGIKIILTALIVASIVMTLNTIFLLDCNLFLFYGISALNLIFLILVIQFLEYQNGVKHMIRMKLYVLQTVK